MTPACYLSAGLAILFLWIPVVQHYYVPGADITDEMLSAARYVPGDGKLEEIKTMHFFGNRWSDKQLITVAEKLLVGKLEIPGNPSSLITMPFAAGDINKPGLKLFLASLKVPEILLGAYDVSGRDEFLVAARDVILGWASYERKAWLPTGLLWNDHAIAERILVLAEFWRNYRMHKYYQVEAANSILAFVVRSSRLLAKPGHFTFSSNHGLMQNLALLHFSIAFPSLPNADNYKRLAINRMRDQMEFYINEEGVVLEHSAGYHKAGLQLIGMGMKYLTLMDVRVPREWMEKYERAKAFYAQLRRPDGSIPTFGDTRNGKDRLGPLVAHVDTNGRNKILKYHEKWAPKQEHSLYPVGGYSIWWSGLDSWPKRGNLTQTVVAWSSFPGHAHKHADELSVLLWASGQTWWTNVGYWPYRIRGRSEAISWSGSNAPHLINESTNSARNTKLNYYGWSPHLAVIDLERRGPHEYNVRRQVIYLQPNLWIVVDHVSGKERSRMIWTTSYNVRLREGELAGSYSLVPRKSGTSNLEVFIIGTTGTKVKQFRGSFKPFAGWEVVGSVIKPAPAIVIEPPVNNAWVAVVFALNNGAPPMWEFRDRPRMVRWKDPENWTMTIPVKHGVVDVRREGNRVSVLDDIGFAAVRALKVEKGPDATKQIAQIRSVYAKAVDKYAKMEVFFGYRIKATWLLICMFIMQESFFVFYKRSGKQYASIRVLCLLSWAGGGVLLVMFFNDLVRIYSNL